MQTQIATQNQPQYKITNADRKRQKRIADAWAAHDGEFEDQLQLRPDGINPNANSNRIEPIVFQGVNFLFGKQLQITASQGPEQKTAQTFLEDTWGRVEKRMPLLQDLATSGAIAGQAFMRIVPNQDATQFRLVLVDPLTVFVQTATGDCQTVLMFCIEYSCEQEINSRPMSVYYREEIQRVDPDGNDQRDQPDNDDTWLIQHWTRIGDRGAWASAGEPILWGYEFPPIFTCQNRSNPHDFWGKPDATHDLIQQNLDINLNQSNAQSVSIIYGQPFLYSDGAGESSIEFQPGRIMGMPPGGSIKSVPIQADLTSTLALLNRLDDNLSEQSAIPGALARQSEMPRINSGIQMEMMYQGLLAKTEMKRCRYGELIIDVSKALLVLAGFSPDIDVSLTWKNPLPHDDLPSAQAILALQQAGVSIDTSLRMMGLDPGEEAEKRNAEAAQKMVAFSRGQGAPPPLAAMPPGQA